LKRRKGEEGAKTMGGIKYIIPVSEEMIAFIPQAIKLRKEKRFGSFHQRLKTSKVNSKR
jgi:hypothetical protein